MPETRTTPTEFPQDGHDPGLRPLDEHEFVRKADAAIAFLETVREQRGLLAALDDRQRERLLRAAGEVARPDPWAKRELLRAALRRRRATRRAADEQLLAQSQIREKRREQPFRTPPRLPTPLTTGGDLERTLVAPTTDAAPRTVCRERACYVCKARFRTLHFYYDSMCPSCGDFNWHKRSQTCDLSGRVALVTGARVKIGYQVAIMLLRAGAHVIATTRFPRDAAARYTREADFGDWGHRLDVHGLDLRHTPSVEAFARHLGDNHARLDVLINNACQTVRRPAGFYGHLMAGERLPHGALAPDARLLLASHEALRGVTPMARLTDPGTGGLSTSPGRTVGLSHAPELSQLALLEEDRDGGPLLFPDGALDADRQQVDLRKLNSWRLPLADVSAVELLEVHLVNAMAPFILNARLKALMLRVPSRDKHIVNVSAMEGQFSRTFKTDKHPHTNMAKAALNMMTRTSAADYVKDGVHMNSVDTGWVTDEDAAEIAARKTADHGFHPPLDIVDGAARICDPIFSGFASGDHVWGLFLKDYVATDW